MTRTQDTDFAATSMASVGFSMAAVIEDVGLFCRNTVLLGSTLAGTIIYFKIVAPEISIVFKQMYPEKEKYVDIIMKLYIPTVIAGLGCACYFFKRE